MAESFAAKTPANLYINVVVQDPSQAIRNKLSERIGDTILPSFIKRRTSRKLGKVAGKMVKPSMVAKKMASKMPVLVPQEMATKGITAELKEHYREGPYLVLRMRVQHVDAAAMATAKTENKSIGAKVQRFLGFIGAKNKERVEAYFLPGLIEKKLPSMMTDMMSEKMAGKGLKADARVLPENKQDRHFEATLQSIRRAAAKLEPEEGGEGEL